ncbi:HEAT repeat domain-containing protein [Candidatus Deferrimicrobium sp.]|uniref:HEAT repeat domain-containing protein n=1 Tax=Candidatus Deferrimicrobium sp. TaxID=3060586 RepID=UPI003C6BAEC6
MIERIEEALVRLLSDRSEAVREAAVGAMDRIRARRSVEEFRSRIRDGTIEEKLRAIYAAAELGGQEGISLLLQALSDRDVEIRGAAVRALSPFPSPGVIKSLWEMLPRERGVVLGNLLETLGASGRRELAPHVEKFLDHPEPEVRAKAVTAYSRLCDGPGWEKILPRTGDPNETVRAAVAEALGGWTSSPRP